MAGYAFVEGVLSRRGIKSARMQQPVYWTWTIKGGAQVEFRVNAARNEDLSCKADLYDEVSYCLLYTSPSPRD